MKPILAILTTCLLLCAQAVVGAEAVPKQTAVYYRPALERKPAMREFEVAVYGGTPAGVTAAIEAARMGRKTLLLSFNQHVGGMTSGGLTATDLGKKESIGGLALDFYTRLGKDSGFSPSVAESLYLTLLQEAGATVLLGRCLEAVEMKGNRIVSATMETGETIRAAVFIDATYEGDLLAAANVSYRVGREPRSAFHESLAGQWQRVSWQHVYQFCRLPVSPYQVADDPSSGLLPEISPDQPGAPGDGDYRVQAYNFRMFLSNREGRVPFPKPAGYDPARYGLLARFLNFDPGVKWTLNYTINLLVPVCLSSSHVAYGSIRMEPVFMILGQSAGAAASLAITDQVPVQQVDYGKLKKRLVAGKQRL